MVTMVSPELPDGIAPVPSKAGRRSFIDAIDDAWLRKVHAGFAWQVVPATLLLLMCFQTLAFFISPQRSMDGYRWLLVAIRKYETYAFLLLCVYAGFLITRRPANGLSTSPFLPLRRAIRGLLVIGGTAGAAATSFAGFAATRTLHLVYLADGVSYSVWDAGCMCLLVYSWRLIAILSGRSNRLVIPLVVALILTCFARATNVYLCTVHAESTRLLQCLVWSRLLLSIAYSAGLLVFSIQCRAAFSAVLQTRHQAMSPF